MTTIFETKEQYLTFRKAWASAVNDERVKSKLVPWSEGSSDKYKEKGWVQAEHYLFYNIVRNRPFDSGFSPVTNAMKLTNGMDKNHGLKNAYYTLSRLVDAAKSMVSGDSYYKYMLIKINHFLEPFSETVTMEMLAKLDVNEQYNKYIEEQKKYSEAA